MKTYKKLLSLILLTMVGCSFANANSVTENPGLFISGSDTTILDTSKTFVVTTIQDAEFIGKIISRSEQEIVILTKNMGKVAIPKYQIKSIVEIKAGDLQENGVYIGKETFHTRYFYTTNALPLKKGDNYVMFHLFGPEVHFGVTDNFGIGIITSWIASPIIVTPKYSMKLSDNATFAVGALLGTGGYLVPDFAFAVPFGALTLGNEKTNLSFSGGYGVQSESSSGVNLFSVGAMAKLTRKSSLILDAIMINSEGGDAFGMLTTGVRIHTSSEKAIQFGFTGLMGGDDIIPIPTVGWFRKF